MRTRPWKSCCGKNPKRSVSWAWGTCPRRSMKTCGRDCQGVEVINATDLVDEIRMVKSEEELTLHREAAYMHEMSYAVAKKAIRPGRTLSEVIMEIRFAQIAAGSEEQQIAITFGQPGRRTRPR